MKLIKYKKIEDCLQGNNVWDLQFEKYIDENFLKTIDKLGKVVVHNFKSKPFFTLIVRGEYTLKGSIGNRSARLILPDSAERKIPPELLYFFKEM